MYMKRKLRILVVEDEAAIRTGLIDVLVYHGYEVDFAEEGMDGLKKAQSGQYDLILLDVMLPGMDGFEICNRVRENDREQPIIMLTAKTSDDDIIQGLSLGADDYVAKPFHMEEILARIRALVRRAAGHASNEIEIGLVRLDVGAGRVTVAGQAVRLTSHEFRLLAYLMHHKGKVISRTELTEHLYDQDFDRDSNTIEVFVGRLRKKLPDNCIETVRGLGYQINDC